ncbi:MAG: TrkA C-terminal domain-containing protein [Christensenellales bacterium]
MPRNVYAPHYMQIALDIASRIARGELQEGSKVYGRSVMASEYGVSPETIRRAMKLLADMQVVRISPQSGVYIASAAYASAYIERFGKRADIRSLQNQLREMIAQHDELMKRIMNTVSAITKINDKQSDVYPFSNYEVKVPKHANVIGKNLAELRFWQATGATIIAIRRADKILLSPGPYAQLHAGDTIVLVGDAAAADAAEKYVLETKGS